VENLWGWLLQNVLTMNMLVEAIVIVVILPIALIVARPFSRRLTRLVETRGWGNRVQGKLLRGLIPLLKFIVAIILLRIGHMVIVKFALSGLLIKTAASLLFAWVVIRFSTSLLRDSNWAKLIAFIAWAAAALHIFNLLNPTIALFDQLAITLGGVRVSLLILIKGVIVFAVLLKIALSASSVLEKRLMSFEDLTPSVQVLLTKSLKVTLLVIAVVVALNTLGINLSAFAFIGGAVGVGVGFGLQKVVSNLISGVILLLDKSIKPGDVIEVGDSYGRIQSLGARYVSVVTRDGFEYLIPNEDLITQQVINWSFSSKLVRLKIGVGVS